MIVIEIVTEIVIAAAAAAALLFGKVIKLKQNVLVGLSSTRVKSLQ